MVLLLASVGHSQTPKADEEADTPRFRVEVWGDIAFDFRGRVGSYFELRRKLEKGLMAPTVTNNPAEIRIAVRALAKRIRVARADAKPGDLFTPAISSAFRKALAIEVGSSIWADIMDDNPGEFAVQINGAYRGGKPFSTVPPTVLAALPNLPDGIEYRFLGRHLILLDARASMILDRIPYAIQCSDNDEWTRSHRSAVTSKGCVWLHR
jgi:hypothetical protein